MLTGFNCMMRSSVIIAMVVAIGFTILPTRARAAGAPGDLVKAELVADVASIKPGEPFTLGILLTMKPGWHVYWKNPGDSGIATKVTWIMPNGYSIGSLQFPIPAQFDLAGKITNFGYENQVMLICRSWAPKNAKPGETVDISADVTWLVCEEQCWPGKGMV